MKSQGMRRIFLALDPPRPVKSSISKLLFGLRRQKLPVEWTPVKNFHVTLVFLGNISPSQIAKLKSLVARISENFAPVSVCLGKIEVFSRASREIVHVEILENDNLMELQATLQYELVKIMSLPLSKKYRPHITIGRCRQNSINRGDDLRSFLFAARFPEKAISWTAPGIDIMESILGSGNPQYLRLQRYNFSKK